MIPYLLISGRLLHVSGVSSGKLGECQRVVLWVKGRRSVVGGGEGGVLSLDGLFIVRALEGGVVVEAAREEVGLQQSLYI